MFHFITFFLIRLIYLLISLVIHLFLQYFSISHQSTQTFQLFYCLSMHLLSQLFDGYFLEAVFPASSPVFVALFKIFFPIFVELISCKSQKSICFDVFSSSWFYRITHNFCLLIIKHVNLTLSFISNALPF